MDAEEFVEADLAKRGVHWDDEWEVYQYIRPDDFIEIFRDDIEAMEYANDHGLEFTR